MIPFDFLEDAEIWMDENACGPICVYVQNPEWVDRRSGVRSARSRWELEWYQWIKPTRIPNRVQC